jgi:hypothetical protein
MKKIRNTQKNKKNNSRMTPKEAFEYYFIKHPFELLVIILFMILVTMSIATWDGTMPTCVGPTVTWGKK